MAHSHIDSHSPGDHGYDGSGINWQHYHGSHHYNPMVNLNTNTDPIHDLHTTAFDHVVYSGPATIASQPGHFSGNMDLNTALCNFFIHSLYY